MTLNHTNVEVILGPPGTGKTTELLRLVEEQIRYGGQPDRVCFLSFTRRAIREAKSRIERDLSHLELSHSDLEHIRTLHSFCMRMLNVNPRRLMTERQWTELGKEMELSFAPERSKTEQKNVGFHLRSIHTIAQNRLKTMLEQHQEQPQGQVLPEDISHFEQKLAQYKQHNSLLEYEEIIRKFIESQHCRHFDVLFIDEAQDLTPLQWQAVQLIADHSKRVVAAGDDDQAIFNWAGSDTQSFVHLPGKKRVLEQSYRLPRRVHSYSQALISRVNSRLPKEFLPKDELGLVQPVQDINQVMMDMRGRLEESWLFLCRSHHETLKVSKKLKEWNVWHGLMEVHGSNYLPPAMDAAYKIYRAYEKARAHEPIPVSEAMALSTHLKNQQDQDRIKELAYEAQDQLTLDWLDLPPFTSSRVLNVLYWNNELEHLQRAALTTNTVRATPNVLVSTIHQAKGTEAENVVMFTQLTSKIRQSYTINPDVEHRLFYVAASRAKHRLFIVQCHNAKLMYDWHPGAGCWDGLQVEKISV